MDGVLLVDKPAGVTSHDVVAQVRRARGGRRAVKVGHAGTLDPFATGLLLVLLGRATRVQRFLMALPKTYETRARLGWTSSTGDPTGELAHTGRVPPLDDPLPTGLLRQRPPAYSAIHVDGERAYARARRGEEVVIPEREVRVDEFTLLRRDDAEHARFRIRCSAGTYVRTLIADLGDAYCADLRRTAIGEFAVEAADPDRVVPLGDAIAFLPAVTLDADGARRAGHGAAVPPPADDPDRALMAEQASAAAPLRLLDPDGGLIALAEPRVTAEGVRLRPVVGFRA